ncbi:MAG TPA: HK97 family phage prohead protease [Thermoanaerobaculales bacterium]|nr:HK97 family phage prohead protease [Thermoanaerobaculales bacterium]HQL30860.1 HK97 family phage prohead protease [Thermoanaerobaculales bacterium]
MPEPRRIVTAEDLARLVAAKRPTRGPVDLAGAVVRQASTGQVAAAADGRDRVLTFVVATDQRNRNGWRINPDGWDLTAYRQNPVVLWAHDETRLPIGRARRVWLAGRQLKAEIEFTPPALSGFNDALYTMLADGWLSATSVGFGVREWEWVEDAEGNYLLDFIATELWEISVVPVGADPAALRVAASAGRALVAGSAAWRRLELARLAEAHPVRGSRAWIRRELRALGIEPGPRGRR